MMPPHASSDDGSMKTIVVNSSAQRIALEALNYNSYFYSNLGCLDVSSAGPNGAYEGIAFIVHVPAGGDLVVDLQTGTSSDCSNTVISYDLDIMQGYGVTAGGAEALVVIPFKDFTGGAQFAPRYIYSIIFAGLNLGVQYTLGPIRLYRAGSSFIPPAPLVAAPPPPGIPFPKPYPVATAGKLVIDNFASGSSTTNALGYTHLSVDTTLLTASYNKAAKTMTLKYVPGVGVMGSDGFWFTQFSNNNCADLTLYANSYLHIHVANLPWGQDFDVAFQEYNHECLDTSFPTPNAWSEVQASRYLFGNDIYIPMVHFNVAWQYVAALVLKSFRIDAATEFSLIEFVDSLPAGITIPGKLNENPVIYSCTVNNTFAIGIDDGEPTLAQEMMQIVKDSGVKVTFFTLGLPLLDPSSNLTNVYREALALGHQIGFHTYTHPYLSSCTDADIQYQFSAGLQAIQQQLGVFPTYIRTPYGNMDARYRQITADLGIRNVQWSIDVEDWLWGTTSTPQKQLTAFNRDFNKGGNIVVMHYLYASTVSYLKDFIATAKAAGKKIVRVDQCIGDPRAPPIV